MTKLTSVNPTTGETVATYAMHSSTEVSALITQAAAAQAGWARVDFSTRAAVVLAVASELEARKEALAKLMAIEMGKPLAQGRAEVEKCANACRYFALHSQRFLEDVSIATEHQGSFVHYEPLGVVLAVMPWNYPLWQVFRFAAPALMAGNVALLKHASNVPGCALAIADMFRAVGAPDGLFTSLLVGSDAIGDLLAHPDVAAATLTGSTEAGRAIAQKAGQELKKTVLELGGSDPYLVLEDADVALAARVCAASRLLNGGQSCISAKRFIVVGDVYDEFVAAFVGHLDTATMGDPLLDTTDIGPLARTDLRETLQRQVENSVAAGARLVLGGQIPVGPGAFYPPTALLDVQPGMSVFDEETFGPVAAIVRARDTDDAVALANATVFGLGSAVFTRDIKHGTEIATKRIRAGSCFVNALVTSDPRLPFGGTGKSGYGRELGEAGIKEFVNCKTIVVDQG